MFEMVRIGLWATLMSKSWRAFLPFVENPLASAEDNHAALIGLINFLLSIKLAAIMNEISRVAISGEVFSHSLIGPSPSQMVV